VRRVDPEGIEPGVCSEFRTRQISRPHELALRPFGAMWLKVLDRDHDQRSERGMCTRPSRVTRQ
jgi:hypothetical protein